MLRIGLVGAGDAASHHARALASLASLASPEVALAGACARTRASAERLCAEHGLAAPVFDSFEALVASRACDAIVLATPDGLHVEQAIAAARAGLHALVEKPLGLTAESAARACQAARAAGTALVAGYHLRHHAGHRALRAAMAERVGEPRHVYVRWAWPDPKTDGWRARGEGARFFAMAALGTHALDLCMWLLGGPPREVSGRLFVEGATDRAAEITLEFPGGAVAHVSVSVRERALSRLVVAGPLGELECAGSLGARGGGELGYRARGGPLVPLAFEPESPYVAQLRAFMQDVRVGAIDTAALENVATLDRLSALLPNPAADPGDVTLDDERCAR